jgi:zinc protease
LAGSGVFLPQSNVKRQFATVEPLAPFCRFPVKIGLQEAALSPFRAALFGLCLLLPMAPAMAADWPHSDIPPDPAVHFGVLPDGMRYAIMRNKTPAGAVSVRFGIAAGSMQEADDQKGLAHFLEHMAFRGSAHFPDGEINKTLERLGLRFGADTNAATGQDQTVYRFDLPRSDEASIDTVIRISRDIAGNLNLDPAIAKTEAGVVLSELRLRDVPGMRAAQAELDFELKDPRAAALPGGDPAIIAAAPIGRIADFYHAFYRPERAFLVVVGDVDPDKVEAKIKSAFADWRGVGRAGSDPDIKIPMPAAPAAALYVEPGVGSSVSLTWIGAPDPKPTTRAQYRLFLTQQIGLQILNRRLQAVAAGPDAPFSGARALRGEVLGLVTQAGLTINYQSRDWRLALEGAEAVRLALLRDGVTPAEVERAITDMRAGRLNAVLAAATRPSQRLASLIMANAIDGDIVESPAENLAMTQEDIPSFTPESVTAALRAMFGKAGPLLFLSSREPVTGGENAVMTEFRAAEKAGAAAAGHAPQALASVKWPYTDFGTPGLVAERRPVKDLGAEFIRFANGVRLTLRPSQFRANQVLVSVKIGNGRLDLPRGQTGAIGLSAAFLQGGLKDLTYLEMQRALTGKSYAVSFGIGDDGILFNGATTSADIDTQLQVLAAYVRDPGFRPEAFTQFKTTYEARLRQSETVPSAILARRSPQIFHDGDARWATPSPAEIEAATPDDVRSLLAPSFQDGPIDITIVGDIDPDDAVKAVAATFGALPPRHEARVKVSPENDTSFPAPMAAPIRLSTAQPSDQNIVSIAWPTHGRFPDLKDDATLQLLSAIMEERLLEKLRGDLGTAYVADVGSVSSKVFDYGYVEAATQLQPDHLSRFSAALDQIVGDLKDGKITVDDLDRAKAPALEDLQRARQTNDYWLSVLDGAQEDATRLTWARSYEAALRAVTPEAIAAAARKYLDDKRKIQLLVGS